MLSSTDFAANRVSIFGPETSIDTDRFVMSSWHDDASLAEPLWFALGNAWPDEDAFPDAAEAAVILAVEEPWLDEVRKPGRRPRGTQAAMTPELGIVGAATIES